MNAVPPTVGKRDLFVCFLLMGLTSFGGVLPFARRMLVERRGWLSSAQFTELLALGQLLPGPNVVNLTIMVGRRFHGWQGALLAFGGLMLAPLVIILLLATLYDQFGQIEAVRRAIGGTAAATAGLVVAMGLSMLRRQPRSVRLMIVTLAAFVASGPLGLPLLQVLAVLVPAAVLLAWSERR